jgi:hypothetical protein
MICLFYLIALIPTIIGIVLWVWKKEVVWWECLIGTVLAFAASGGIHFLAIHGMTSDTEIWSGHLRKAIRHPKWVETYQEAVYKTVTRTVGSGKNRRTVTERVFSHYETRYRTHPEYREAHVFFGKKSEKKRITKEFFEEIIKNFGGKVDKVRGSRPGYYSGDKFDYHVNNHTNYVYPATMWQRWENRVKAAPTTFSFIKVPEKVTVHEYPKCANWRSSDRVIGTATKCVTTVEWDRMCSRLGPMKKVNVILVGFSGDSMMGQYQQAKWVGGRKNDLVLCFGEPSEKPSWAFVFGWTEKEVVKRNLETILLEGPVSNELLPKIEAEIMRNYTIKDWSKFDYITIEPPWWSYLILILFMALTQTGFYAWAYLNNVREGQGKKRWRGFRR